MGKKLNFGDKLNPGPATTPGSGIATDPFAGTSDYACEECGNMLFENKIFIKKKSRFASNSGKEEIMPLNILVCSSCGKVPPVLEELKASNIIPKELFAKTE